MKGEHIQSTLREIKSWHLLAKACASITSNRRDGSLIPSGSDSDAVDGPTNLSSIDPHRNGQRLVTTRSRWTASKSGAKEPLPRVLSSRSRLASTKHHGISASQSIIRAESALSTYGFRIRSVSGLRNSFLGGKSGPIVAPLRKHVCNSQCNICIDIIISL